MPSLGKQIIIGLPDLLGNYFDYFTTILEKARLRKPAVRLERLQQLYGLCTMEIHRVRLKLIVPD